MPFSVEDSELTVQKPQDLNKICPNLIKFSEDMQTHAGLHDSNSVKVHLGDLALKEWLCLDRIQTGPASHYSSQPFEANHVILSDCLDLLTRACNTTFRDREFL